MPYIINIALLLAFSVATSGVYGATVKIEVPAGAGLEVVRREGNTSTQILLIVNGDTVVEQVTPPPPPPPPPPIGPVPSPNGTRAATVIDAQKATWTFDTSSRTLKDGVVVSGRGTIYGIETGVLFVKGTDARWYRRATDSWVFYSDNDPGVVVPPPPPPPVGTWNPVVNLVNGGTFSGIAAAGRTIVAAVGEGTISSAVSVDQGTTFSAFAGRGAGTLYLEHPIAIDGQKVGIAGVVVSSSITDFWGPRAVGDVFVRRSVDGGKTYAQPTRATNGKRVLRLSLGISGSVWHLVYMTWTGTTWDIEHVRSTDDGLTWGAPVVIANGVNAVGAERPSLAVVGSRVYVAIMDARMNLAACTIEGGVVLPNCTEVYLVVSNDAGATWAAPRRLTSDLAYSGRPDIYAFGPLVAIVYDHREQAAGSSNDIGLLLSQDAGASFVQSMFVSAAGDQSHGVVAISSSGLYVAWQDSRGGAPRVWAKSSRDNGKTWSADERISNDGDVGAPGIALTDDYVHVSWGEGGSMKYSRKFIGPSVPSGQVLIHQGVMWKVVSRDVLRDGIYTGRAVKNQPRLVVCEDRVWANFDNYWFRRVGANWYSLGAMTPPNNPRAVRPRGPPC